MVASLDAPSKVLQWPLRRQLAAIILLVAVPLNLVMGLAVWSLAKTAHQSQRKAILFTAHSVAAAVDAELSKYLILGQTLSRSPALVAGDLTTFEVEARRAFEGDAGAWLAVADADGQQLLNLNRRLGETLPRRTEIALAAQREAARTGKPVVSDVLTGLVTGEPIVAIDFPVRDKVNSGRGLAIAIKAKVFLALLNAPDTPSDWLVGVIDRSGNFVARTPDHDARVGKPASSGWRAVRDVVGVHDFHSIEGDDIVQGITMTSRASWSVGVAVKKAELNAAIWRSLAWALALGVIVSGLSIALATQLARRVTGAVADLGHNAAKLLGGEEKVAEPSLPDLVDTWGNLKRAVADRKDADQRLRLVMREVNHRSKNLLTVIQSIARQTASARHEDFLRRFANRLEALSASQDLLVKSEWKGVEIDELVRSQLAPYQGLIDKRIRISGAAVRVSPAAAQTLGMALHELATNAAKYGALSNDTGMIAVHWSLDKDHGQFAVSWTETGGPVTTAPTAHGFGSTVIGRMVQLGLRADVDVDFRPEGLVWRMSCPAGNVLDCGGGDGV